MTIATGNAILAADVNGFGHGHITILPWAYNSIGQGTWVISINDVYALNTRLYNSSNANLDNLSYKVYLPIGTYTLRFLTLTTTLNGIVDFDIDATEVASFDTYTLATVNGVVFSQTAISIATAGLKTLTLRIHGQNGASTGFYATIHSLSLWRTA